ncbi:hypothetical protein CDAR_92011 [Caerostris darwini]|uniref:Uncharacterized protein n=1 Tax=Caerostris darwini TaxID=1538125 RepID=A0AAV4QKL4_9ARAC|nr:hypothetical protein CDAR_92011 [Caerostris darwini]
MSDREGATRPKHPLLLASCLGASAAKGCAVLGLMPADPHATLVVTQSPTRRGRMCGIGPSKKHAVLKTAASALRLLPPNKSMVPKYAKTHIWRY